MRPVVRPEPSRKLIPLSGVEFNNHQPPQHFSSFAQATEWLDSKADTFPRNGYDRVEFRVQWNDGAYCSGRFNARHPENPLFIDFDIGRQIRRQATFLINAVSYHFAGQRRFETAKRILDGQLALADQGLTVDHAA
ncbi:MAG: hypothetical protein P8124_13550 [Gammaproteobacteria bacterium]